MNTPSQKTTFQLGSVEQVPPGEGREFNVDGLRIAVFHTRQGAFYATQALCPHRQGPLVDGLIGGTTLMCPLHSWKFNLMSGDALTGDCGIETYSVILQPGGQIVLEM